MGRGSIVGMDVYHPAKARVIWIDGVVPAPELNLHARDRRAKGEIAITALDVGSEEPVEDSAAPCCVKDPP